MRSVANDRSRVHRYAQPPAGIKGPEGEVHCQGCSECLDDHPNVINRHGKLYCGWDCYWLWCEWAAEQYVQLRKDALEARGQANRNLNVALMHGRGHLDRDAKASIEHKLTGRINGTLACIGLAQGALDGLVNKHDLD